MRILVVDDEALVARSIRRAFREHEVVIEESGQGAIAVLESGESFDVILCDIMMPDVSGMDVFEHVRSRRPELERRFVFMTGGAFTARAREFLDNVQNEHIEKPFDLGRVRSVVQAIADGG